MSLFRKVFPPSSGQPISIDAARSSSSVLELKVYPDNGVWIYRANAFRRVFHPVRCSDLSSVVDNLNADFNLEMFSTLILHSRFLETGERDYLAAKIGITNVAYVYEQPPQRPEPRQLYFGEIYLR
ncbi:hypothetical protein COV20_04765 [Candidatus Woesearchaeota archaeon CG10_big_fil_rev_8_21_14_0_10_45_16]|nr:MAG: hypothetical protein COV20_04765 [Candidatus Woesearchaeota archaeon CG10_big_fil_rev_8_21_14_0_10_45_16]